MIYISDVDGSHDGGYAELFGVPDDSLGSISTFLLKTILITLVLVKLVEEVYVCLTILNVFAEVVNLLLVGGVGQMVIEPTDEELLSRELE